VVVLQNQGAFDIDSLVHLCLDADAGDVGNYGHIIQYDCANLDGYQQWAFVYVGNGRYMLRNQASGTCLDADADKVGDYDKIIQFSCNPADDYQLWYITDTGGGNLSIKSYGASNVGNGPICLDADFYQQYNTGDIIQWTCNTSDSFQLWSIQPTN
jgi:Ricin-type beta-trefoil lectin domain